MLMLLLCWQQLRQLLRQLLLLAEQRRDRRRAEILERVRLQVAIVEIGPLVGWLRGRFASGGRDQHIAQPCPHWPLSQCLTYDHNWRSPFHLSAARPLIPSRLTAATAMSALKRNRNEIEIKIAMEMDMDMVIESKANRKRRSNKTIWFHNFAYITDFLYLSYV